MSSVATAKTPAVKPQATQAVKKSGLRQLAPSQVLFNDGETADSLFIIQKGQIRLYKPKGKGFIELAVLRAGEVIGEMAFFDDDGSGKKRSCAAMAITSTEVIEISFSAFGKTMESLNPWFKTIINTLATRLRKTNARVRELENNSANLNYGSKGYEFLKALDVIKMLSTIYLVIKGHGEKQETQLVVHRNTIDLYANDIYSLTEAKFETILQILIDLNYLSIANDKDNLPKVIVSKNIESLKNLLIFLNTQRHLEEAKKLKVTNACEVFLERIAKELANSTVEKVKVNLSPLIAEFKEKNAHVDATDLDDAIKAGLLTEPNINKSNQVESEVQAIKMRQLLPMIRFINRLHKENQKREGS